MAPQRTCSWPLTLLAIQIGCYSAAEIIYPSEATGVGWTENVTLQNLEAETARPAVYSAMPKCMNVDPVTLCTQHCLKRVEYCSSFSFWNTSKHCICKLYKSPSFLIENMNYREGARYFYATNDRCPVHKGYRLLHFEVDRNLCLLYLGKMSASAQLARDTCIVHDGVLPKFTNKYVTDVIVEFVGANTLDSTILIQAGVLSIGSILLWEIDGTPISTQPRKISPDARYEPDYWNHTFWTEDSERGDYRKRCLYTNENGWFMDDCETKEKDLVCQYRFSEGRPTDGGSLIGISGKVYVGGAALARAAPWLLVLALGAVALSRPVV